jgi:hypothetical protein
VEGDGLMPKVNRETDGLSYRLSGSGHFFLIDVHYDGSQYEREMWTYDGMAFMYAPGFRLQVI